MDVIATWLLALTKNKIPINVRGDPIKSLLYMPGGHSMTIIFLINMLGGPIKSPINMPSGHCKYESAGSQLIVNEGPEWKCFRTQLIVNEFFPTHKVEKV